MLALFASAASAGTADYKVAERYRFNLGGDVGQYTDWERQDLARFDGLVTTFRFGKVYGKKSDKWDSIGRINLHGPGEGDGRAMISIIFLVDRKTHGVTPIVSDSITGQKGRLDVTAEGDKPITFSAFKVADADKMLLKVNDTSVTIPSTFEIRSVSVIGSGVDLGVEKFELVHRQPAEAGKGE
ncbi:hypothetical protein [Tahibacter amnicola]|uniref:Uncharacterized protein n=1 Tax=Tahibacter amnicola TaxID=2976241 RepID=A0ABY6BHG9_9GAMM|nr:hypothetical protein [Tahibacter amnicola]UXI69300.1 hypothetical protein N4264_06535 [Tahibacter amnicola]